MATLPPSSAAGAADRGGWPLALAFVLPCFACNSLLCRVALREGAIDPASFSSVRLGAAALALSVFVALKRARAGTPVRAALPWDPWAAIGLSVYSLAFACAYAGFGAAAGGIVLFAVVQLTLLAWAVARGERLNPRQWLGVAGAFGGGVSLLAPRIGAVPMWPALTMALAGLGWAAYTIRGTRRTADALEGNAANFVFAAAMGLAVQWLAFDAPHATREGLAWAAMSGAVASAAAYVVWYRILPRLAAARAAIAQLLVPPLTVLGGIGFLGESATRAFWAGSALIIASLALLRRAR